MTASVSVKYSPRFTAAERELLALPGRLRRLDVLAELGVRPAVVRVLREHWRTHGAAFGHAWKALARSTILAKTRRGTVGKGPLRDKDDLFESVFAPSAIRVVTTSRGVRVEVKPSDPKWIFHQRPTARSHVPQRMVVPQPFPRSLRNDVRAMARDYILTGQVRGEGGRFLAFRGGQ